MKLDIVERTVLVPLPAAFVEVLLKAHGAFDSNLVSALETGLNNCSWSPIKPDQEEATRAVSLSNQRHAVEFLGVLIAKRTLPEVFAEIVDLMAEVAPEALDRLSEFKARSRRFVSRKPEAIHPGSRHLPVMRTASGWWISKNIGQEDLKRALRALCMAADITFGKDLIGPLQVQADGGTKLDAG